MIKREDILNEAVDRCLTEMYKRAQPSISWKKIKELTERGVYNVGNQFIDQHYLSKEEYTDIINEYIAAYDLHNPFKENCDTVSKYLKDGGRRDVIIREDNLPPRREIEDTPKLSDAIGDENAQVVLDLVDACRNYFRGEGSETGFRFNVMNYSPSSNKEAVQAFWKAKGKKIKIKDRYFDEESEEWVTSK